MAVRRGAGGGGHSVRLDARAGPGIGAVVRAEDAGRHGFGPALGAGRGRGGRIFGKEPTGPQRRPV